MKKFFHKIHVAIYRWYTFLLIGMATKAVHKLMLMIGKDPNYVPPPPPPVTSDQPARLSTNIIFPHNAYYVNDPKEHPILKSRIAYQEKLAKQAAEKAAMEAEQKAAEVAQQALQVTEVGGETVDALREAVFNGDRTVIDPDNKAN